MNTVACEQDAGDSNDSSPPITARWHLDDAVGGTRHTRTLAIAGCILAILIGTLLAFGSLPAARPSARLVSLYLPPPDDVAFGIDAPHPPAVERLFGLLPVNQRLTGRRQANADGANANENEDADSGSKSSQQDASSSNANGSGHEKGAQKAANPDGDTDKKNATASKSRTDANRGKSANSKSNAGRQANPDSSGNSRFARADRRTDARSDWREAVANGRKREPLVLHVASMADVQHGQVILFGRGNDGQSTRHISLADVLAELRKCPTRSKLLVLDIHWPWTSDEGDSSKRLQRLNETIENQLARFPDPERRVLLASDGEGPARGMAGTGHSLLSHFLTLALQTDDADTNHDGRTTLTEVIAWAKPRIRETSRRLGSPQSIMLVESGNEFALPPVKRRADQDEMTYPDWLTQAWETWQRYLYGASFPWIPELEKTWGRRLAQIEARWRRGEENAEVRLEKDRIEASFVAQIEQALDDRRQQRCDSLLLAADRFAEATQRRADAAYDTLWQTYQSIPDSMPPDVQEAKIEKAVARYAAAFEPEDAVVGIAKTIEPLAGTSEIDQRRVQLIDKVRAAWHAAPQFPITDAIRRLAAEPDTDTLAGSLPDGERDTRRAQILQLYLHQDRLGGQQTATALIRPLAEQTTQKLTVAQRMVWNPGMTDDEVVDDSLRSANEAAVMVLDGERTVAIALRRIGHVLNTMQVDNSRRVVWTSAEQEQELIRRTSKVVDALTKLRKTLRSDGRIVGDELLLVQQSSESLHRHWQALLDQPSDRVRIDRVSFHAGVSVALDPTVRARLLTAAPRSPVAAANDPFLTSLLDENQHPARNSSSNATAPQTSWEAIIRGLEGVVDDADDQYQRWWSNFIGAARDIAAMPLYREIAERDSIVGRDQPIPVEIHGSPESLSWNAPSTTVTLRYPADVPDARSVRFEVVPPVTDNFEIYPKQGVIAAGGARELQFRLSARAADTAGGTIEGIWLRLTRDDQTQLVPVNISSQPIRPSVEVDFGPNGRARGSDIELALWPDVEPQPLHWNVVVNDASLKSVVASLHSESGAELKSAPISVSHGQPSAIRFLPPSKKKDDASGAEPKLDGKITLVLADAKENELRRWQITTRLRDPRQAIRLGEAVYTVHRDGSNHMDVRVGMAGEFLSTDSANRYSPTLGLGLKPKRIDGLIDVGRSHLQTRLSLEQPMAELSADDLRVKEGKAVTATIPLAVNGDEGIYRLVTRLPRRHGTVRLQWDRKPSLALDAPSAVVPGASLEAVVQARNLDDAHGLLVECLDGDPQSSRDFWRTELGTARQSAIHFDAGGTDATVAVTAVRRDWRISIPTDVATGQHRLRVSTTSPVGERTVSAETGLLIDDRVPDDVHVRAERHPDRTTAFVSLRPNPSGVAELSLRVDDPVDKSKSVTVKADPLDQRGSRWRADWPSKKPVPKRVAVTLTTKAGKPFETTCDVALQKVVPTARVTGQVREGSIPQPRLVLRLQRPGGAVVASTKTGPDGRYAMTAPPGRYVIQAEKSSTGRAATQKLSLQDEQTTKADLELLKPTAPP